jgi:hypothetical protein
MAITLGVRYLNVVDHEEPEHEPAFAEAIASASAD